MIATTTYRLKLTFTAPLLGSQPSRELVTEYIAKRHGIELDDEERLLLPDLLERETTIFHRQTDGSPLLLNYHVLGFLKEAGKVLNGKAGAGRGVERGPASGVRNLRWKVSAYVSVSPRLIPLRLPDGEQLDYFERPLRAETARGPRVAIARSEMAPTGTWIECGLEVISSEISQDVLLDLLDYGWSHGLGQWRSSGAFGTFRYELDQET